MRQTRPDAHGEWAVLSTSSVESYSEADGTVTACDPDPGATEHRGGGGVHGIPNHTSPTDPLLSEDGMVPCLAELSRWAALSTGCWVCARVGSNRRPPHQEQRRTLPVPGRCAHLQEVGKTAHLGQAWAQDSCTVFSGGAETRGGASAPQGGAKHGGA